MGAGSLFFDREGKILVVKRDRQLKQELKFIAILTTG
jgi:hypothetical protein